MSTILLPLVAVFGVVGCFFGSFVQLSRRRLAEMCGVIFGICLLTFVFGNGSFWLKREKWREERIWIDVYLAIAIGWCFVVPQARSVGMRIWPWTILVVATGIFGFLLALTRLAFLLNRSIQL